MTFCEANRTLNEPANYPDEYIVDERCLVIDVETNKSRIK